MQGNWNLSTGITKIPLDKFCTEDVKPIKIKNKLNSILSKHTKQPIKKIAEDTDRDNFMSADDSVKYGLVDKVISSRTEVK